jgi:hypothetical protein
MAQVKPQPARVPPAGKTGVNPFAGMRGLLLDSRNRLNLKTLNFFLFVCVAALAVRCVTIIQSSYKKMRTIDFRITGQESAGEVHEKIILKKVDYYLEKVKKRNIFKMGLPARPDNMIESAPSSKAVDATQTLRVVGISWSDDPDAMVEDTKAGKTFFVKKGQAIGDIKVENITKDKVIFRVGEELIELR